MNREDLKNYKHSKQWVDDQLDDYNKEIEKVMKLGQVISDMPKAKNKPNYALEEVMDKYYDLLELVKEEKEKLNLIMKQLNELDPLYKNILYKRYIEGRNLEYISTKIGYSYNRTCTYNGYALNEFDKLDKKFKVGKKC